MEGATVGGVVRPARLRGEGEGGGGVEPEGQARGLHLIAGGNRGLAFQRVRHAMPQGLTNKARGAVS